MNPDVHCPTDRCHNATWADQSWLGGNVPGMNLLNPPVKDTVTVPAGAYVVIRFPADNPGNLPFLFSLIFLPFSDLYICKLFGDCG